jgi:ATP-dependent Clp protease ATP-binding subunit ClpB
MKRVILEVLKKSFRPEFLNRIDEIVVFHSLSKENIVEIAKLQLEYLGNRLKDRGVNITFSDSAVKFLSERGYDQNYGARPLKRVIQNHVETPLAKEIIQGAFKENAHITADFLDDRIIFKSKS